MRLHYVYPYPHVDQVMPLMAEGRVLPYLDIPFQHASPKVLKAMRRPAHQEKTLERIARWREICPDLAIRSTFIVGFPGETEEDFALLLDWLPKPSSSRVGCFKYENVDGAAANALPGQVPEEVKDERYAPLDAAPAGDQRRAARHARRQDASRSWSTRSMMRAPSPARIGTRRRSTEMCICTARPASSPATG